MKCSPEQLRGQCLCVYKHKCLHTHKQTIVIRSGSEQGYVGRITGKEKRYLFSQVIALHIHDKGFSLLILHLFSEL